MKKKSVKGLRVQFLDAVLMVVCCLMTVFVLRTTIKIKNKYENLIFLMNDYTECSVAITEMKKSSGKLTYNTICFLINNNSEYLKRYFYELEVINRRQRAVDIVELTHRDDITDINLRMAMREANELVKMDCYAMRLMCEGLEYKEEDIPEQIRTMEILPEHEKLSNKEKQNFARNLLFSDRYLKSRDLVSEYTDIAAAALINIYVGEEVMSDGYISRQFTLQKVLIIVLLIFCITLYVMLIVLIFIPLHRHLHSIEKGNKMELIGAYEVRYVAAAYNLLCDKNALDASILKHKAEHDHLTGLINRTAFDDIMASLSISKEPVAYLIIDIDLFKGVNDQYGHVVGDQVLMKIANLLTDQFRTTDYVARIGGDEFAIIMTKFGKSATEIIWTKIKSINDKLQAADDNLPPVSLSVGVAFSDEGFKTSLIENADKALYKVKRGGRCNCFFSED